MATLDQFVVMIEGQEGITYDALLAEARAAERLGYGGLFRSDHWLPIMGGRDIDATDAWATLAGLARETSRIRIGALVSPITFRHPAEMAKIIATVDQMSGGRVDVGLGAGWYEAEHTAHGVHFPGPGERIDRLVETLEVCTRLWADGPSSFEGRYYRLDNAPGSPKPVQRPRPPIITGGRGPKRAPEVAARFSDEYNTGGTVEQWCERRDRVLAACERVGRDPSTMRFSWFGPTIVGRDEADLRRRVRARMNHVGATGDAGAWIAAQQETGAMVATVDQAVEHIAARRAQGASRWYLQTVPHGDHEMLELIAREVVPRTG
jgi:F420-dependent oxidoreductase-like protein